MKKLFSIIMCVLMIMCYMPSMAFANSDTDASSTNYGTIDIMAYDGTIVTLSDGEGLASNETAEKSIISGDNYVAKYSGGTLYLKGYNIEISKAATAVSDTDDTVALNAINGNSFKINVESASSIKLTNTADNGFVRAIYASYLVLSGAEKLTIDVSHTPQNEANTTKSGTGVYGINAECGAKIEAPVDITVAGKYSVYGIGAECGTISLTGGDKSIDVLNGGQGAFGVYNYAASYAEYLGITTGNGDINVDCNLNIAVDAAKDGKGIFSYGGTTCVSSGTFNFDPTAYVDTDKGFSVSQDGDNWVVSDAVADVNGVKYGTLKAAIDAAQSGDTIVLLSDVEELGTRGTPIYYDLSNKTLDLGGYTYRQYNFAHVFYGDNATIKNGTMIAVPDPNNNTDEGQTYSSYALAIGYGEGDADYQANNFTAENLTLYGGVNMNGKGTATLKNLNVSGGLYYAVWADTDAQVTIESGSYSSEQIKGNGVLAIATGEGSQAINVKGGTFTVKSGKNLVLSGYGNPSITGGTFNINPSAYLANGYVVIGNADGTWAVKEISDNVKVEKDGTTDTTTVTETTTEGTTKTETKSDGTTTTTVTTNPVVDKTAGTTTSTETKLEVKKVNGKEVKTKTETETVATSKVTTAVTAVTTTDSQGNTVVETTKKVQDTSNNVEVQTKVTDTKAEVVAKIAEDKTVTKKAVTVDATAATADAAKVKTAEVTLPVDTVKALSDIAASTETTKKIETVELKTNVATLEIDSKALKTMTDSAKESNEALVLSVEKKDEPAAEEKITVEGNKEVAVTAKYELTATVGGKEVFSVDDSETNGEITISVPYTPVDENSTVKVYYINGDTATDMNASYKDGLVTWTTNHFTTYGFGEVSGKVAMSGASVTAQAGETISVDVNVDENSGMAQLMFDLEYDKTALELTSVTNGSIFEDKYFTGLDTEYTVGDDVTLQWDRSTPADGDSTGNITETGKLVTLTFKVKEGTKAKKYDIKFTGIDAYNYDLASVGASASNATVEVVLLGDVNEDGIVNTADTMNLRRYIAKWKSYTADTLNLNVADLDGDTKYTLRDVAILGRHVANWTGYETLPYEG